MLPFSTPRKAVLMTEFVPVGDGLYSTNDLMETPPGSGLYAFEPAFPSITGVNPHAHLVYNATDLAVGTETITVTRSYGNRTATVQEGERRFAAGGTVLDDWMIPLGVNVTYTAEQFDAAGTSLGTTTPIQVRWDDDPSLGWISDPLSPGDAVQVELVADFADTMSRTRQMQLHQVGDRVVSLLGAAGKLQNLTVHCQTKNLADGERLTEILAATSVLIRVPPPTRVPRLLYCVIPTVNEIDMDVQWGGEWIRWDLTGQEVDPTTLDIVLPIVSWQTYIDAFPTWADMEAAYPTWFDAMKNPPGA